MKTRVCPRCHAPLPAEAPPGPCPRCLAQAGLVPADPAPTLAAPAPEALPVPRTAITTEPGPAPPRGLEGNALRGGGTGSRTRRRLWLGAAVVGLAGLACVLLAWPRLGPPTFAG